MSWTVIRSHKEFEEMGNAVQVLDADIPACPHAINDEELDVTRLTEARNELQEWLTTVLTVMYKGGRQWDAVRDFLIQGPNMMPTKFEPVSWTQFNPVLMEPPRPTASAPSSQTADSAHSANLDDMDMDDMFMGGDDASVPRDDHDDDEDYIPSAAERYKQTDENVTDADEMEILDLAGEFEMVEDIGSLAQSMGASHLGRSLQLQTEMSASVGSKQPHIQQGLDIGRGTDDATVGGGLGNVMAQAEAVESNTNTAFHAKPIQSAPRLDSFKLIKVIGKGSFGTLHWFVIFFIL